MRALNGLMALVVWLAVTDATAQEADLHLQATGIYSLEGSVRVTAAVTNEGPDDVSDVEITAQFDTALATASQLDPGCSGSSVGVVCAFSALDSAVLAVGEELVVEFVVTPDAGAADVALGVRSSTSDPDESNNSATVDLIADTMVDVALDERAIDAGRRRTLVFTATNHGPDTATSVRISGSVTVNFAEAIARDGATALTGMESSGAAVCGRQVPNSEELFDRWTFPVSCSIDDLAVGDEVEFRFWFEGAGNAQFRLASTSANRDTDPANDVTDGDFANSPIEVVSDAPEEGCCATSRPRGTSVWLLAGLGLFFWRRKSHRTHTCV